MTHFKCTVLSKVQDQNVFFKKYSKAVDDQTKNFAMVTVPISG
jgi:hypothetical protein